MKKLSFSVGLVGLGFLAAACSGGNVDPAPLALGLEAQLEADTGVAWNVVREDDGNVGVLFPEHPVKVGEGGPIPTTKAFFGKYGHSAGGSVERFDAGEVETDDDGISVVRFAHHAPLSGLPVFDAETSAAFAPTGELIYAKAGFSGDLDAIPTTPAYGTNEAIAKARATLASTCGDTGPEASEPKVELGLVTTPAPALTYHVTLGASGTCANAEVLLDASSGAPIVVSDGSRGLEDTKATGVYYHQKGESSDIKTIHYEQHGSNGVLETPAIPDTTEAWVPRIMTRAWTPAVGKEADIVRDASGTWDGASSAKGNAVDAHYHTERAMEFFRDTFGRRSIDSAGRGDVLVVVHDPVDGGRTAKSSVRLGTAYRGGQLVVVQVGDGGGDRLPVGAAFDVMVHELTHGIVRDTSALQGSREAGALDESFADVMAASAELWIQSTKRPLNVPPTPTLIGERFTANKRGIRDLERPSAFGHPDHYSVRYQCAPGEPASPDNDNCGIHQNAGISNRAWSLMALGGTHGRTGVRVSPIGWKRAAKLWFETFVHAKGQPNSTGTRYAPVTMKDIAAQMVARAAFHGGDAVIAAACAWHAVGLGDYRVAGFTTNMCARVAAMTPKLSTSTCAGVAFGYVCQDGSPMAAYICVNGSIVDGVRCSDPQKKCRRRAQDDWTATYDIATGLVCD